MTQLPLPLASHPEGGASLPPIPRGARIHVNRNLRLDAISAVGFDLDYTLAVYRQDAMDRLQTEVTLKKMIERGYPSSLLTAPIESEFAIRGLFVDKKLGHILKMDRYRYVKLAYHGHTRLSREERRRLYHSRPVHAGTKRFHWVDTLYALPEVSVFAMAVEHLEKRAELEARESGTALVELDYGQLFNDIRECIDIAHQDGSVIGPIQKEPERFVTRDPLLPHALLKLKAAGKRLFLITNSGPAYTDTILGHLLDGAVPEHPSWRSYFDAIVCWAKKPRFFTETDLPVLAAEAELSAPVERFEPGRLYTGGCLPEMERLLGISGDEILYVGDHIYGDVLRAKKESAWRTMMVVQEMATELDAHEKAKEDLARLDELHGVAELHVDELRMHQAQLRAVESAIHAAKGEATDGHVPTSLETARITHRKAIERIRARLSVVDAERDQLEERVDQFFHPSWGALFKTGPEVSCFGDQVEQYACLYTDRVSNLLHYSTNHYFRGPRDRMPHEL